MVYDNFYDLCKILLDRNNYDFTPLYLNDCGDNNEDRLLSMQKLSFCVLSEFIQFKQLEKVIDKALEKFNFENQLSNLDDKTNMILENIVQKYTELMERLTLSQIVVSKKNMEVSLLKSDVSFILSVILNNCGVENERLVLAYLPILIFTFSVNHNQLLSNNLKKFHDGDKTQNKTIKSALTNIKLNPKTKVDTSKLSDNVNKSNKLYMYTCFFIQILCEYKSNFVLSFLWFERNLGFFQYYLKANEYLEIINYIAEYKLTGSDVSVSVTLSKKISEYYNENMHKDVCNIIDLLGN